MAAPRRRRFAALAAALHAARATRRRAVGLRVGAAAVDARRAPCARTAARLARPQVHLAYASADASRKGIR